MMESFKKTRIEALEYWLGATNRKRYRRNDIVRSTYECKWQNTNIGDDEHVSIFCSMGSFTTNITDLLTDTRFDSCTFDDNDEILFRFYTRVLLVTSEVLTDFQDIIKEIKQTKSNSEARKSLQNTDSDILIQNLFEYVNKVCKHKVSNLHLKNHHAKILFCDDPIFERKEKSLHISNVKECLKQRGTIDFIELPKLIDIMDVIIDGYKSLDKIFNDDKDKFESFCIKYKTINHI